MRARLNLKNILIFGVIIVAGCYFLLKNQQLKAQNGSGSAMHKPNVHISVKKQTDKNGNIISYDSTYTSTWSANDSSPAQNDSLRKEFNFQFDNKPFAFDKDFDSTFGSFGFDNRFFRDNDFFFNNPDDSSFYGFSGNVWKEIENRMRQHQELIKRYFKNSHNFFYGPGMKLPKDSGSFQHKALPKNEKYYNVPEI